jgi:Zn-dependent oligopeptidase
MPDKYILAALILAIQNLHRCISRVAASFVADVRNRIAKTTVLPPTGRGAHFCALSGTPRYIWRICGEYYSYKWAEVLSADALQHLKKQVWRDESHSRLYRKEMLPLIQYLDWVAVADGSV